MKDDIFESVSQRGSREETAENSRIHEVADELNRRCQLYEAQFRDGQDDAMRKLRRIMTKHYSGFIMHGYARLEKGD